MDVIIMTDPKAIEGDAGIKCDDGGWLHRNVYWDDYKPKYGADGPTDSKIERAVCKDCFNAVMHRRKAGK